MPNLFAMSFEGELAPSFELLCLQKGQKLPDGWGIGYYPGGEASAPVLKEAAPPEGSIRSELIKAWEHLDSSLFLLHIRKATWGRNCDANTQPFKRTFGGRDWLMAHGGSLKRRFALSAPNFFEPVGGTDSELVFCELLNRAVTYGQKSLGDIPPEVLRQWLVEINDHGSLSLVMTDGRDLVVYRDKRGETELHLWQVLPPYQELAVGDEDLAIDLTKRDIKARKGVLVASNALVGLSPGVTPKFRKLEPSELVVIRQGAVTAELREPLRPTTSRPESVTRIPVARPKEVQPQTYDVLHKTTYRYVKPIERSTHLFRKEPMQDRLQKVLSHELTVSVDGASRDYDDVFGNRCRRVHLERPFTELTITARSRVEVLDLDPFGEGRIRERSTIPLTWMPWQHAMLQPFLLPPELPESELRELWDYAMSFVERSDYDLLDTMLDINASIFKEYAYKPGTTTLATTPFEVYTARRGVCQDFSNLFICLARLLGVPARYVCGYVFTGPKHQNHRMGEATHAWVQLYLPELGWRGFDPTNGTVTQTEHIRTAVGRNFIDAAPTSGTIYIGGAGETLEVDVRVDPAT